ncbi:SitI3 family protein [Taibaiella soli]|uniref:Uncharacterized protein n=1 Tax=Taibaiella soli TaxID=1649169 RepID=A0A2W2AK21_9BACT|nr:SitI3 family protein [Taibaiella soli]PZF73902.1 hypothetical protein DN068_06050 [Taibaiella soli]
MAISYNFYVNGHFEIKSSLELFLTENKISYQKSPNEKYDLYNDCGILIGIKTKEVNHFEYEANEKNIDYTWGKCTEISFRTDKFFDYNKSLFCILKIVQFLLIQCEADAVLLANNESLLLKREKGIITTNNANENFTSMLKKILFLFN